MKALIFLLLSSAAFAAKSVVLVSYFDPFKRAPFNNSKNVALGLEKKLAGKVDFKLCPLQTKFEAGFAGLEDCLKALPERPALVIGLGESNCRVKLESMLKNREKTAGPDNAGVERFNDPVIPEGPEWLALRYPAPQMYCGLTSAERARVDVSNDAGTFVCNSTSYKMAYHYPELQFGFIHVPANSCTGVDVLTTEAIGLLEKMILTGVGVLGEEAAASEARLPLTRKELRSHRQQYKNDACLAEYFDRYRVPGLFQ